jgi:hypothetical protein
MDEGKLVLKEKLNEQYPEPEPDLCRCSDCGWEGRIADCEQEWDSEGWEYPSYLVILCPVCEEGGCIDDYFFSRRLARWWNRHCAQEERKEKELGL